MMTRETRKRRAKKLAHEGCNLGEFISRECLDFGDCYNNELFPGNDKFWIKQIRRSANELIKLAARMEKLASSKVDTAL